jgi:hypothetical protein
MHFEEPWSPGALRIAGLYFFLDEKDNGFRWLEKSCSMREFEILYLEIDDMFDSVRADPRYQNVLERIGLKEALLVQ